MTEESKLSNNIRLCECGCQEKIPIISFNRKLRFKHGHNSRGMNNPNWRGGRQLTQYGYIRISAPGHPRTDRYGRILEHILIMEKKIGRYLKKGEVVHHINGIKSDNRPENLQLMKHRDHSRIENTVSDISLRHCIDCNENTIGKRWHTRGLPDGKYRCNRCYLYFKRKRNIENNHHP